MNKKYKEEHYKISYILISETIQARSNLDFDVKCATIQFYGNSCVIRDKLDLMRNVVPINENKRIQRAWMVNNIDS
jgi:hypothetical protein